MIWKKDAAPRGPETCQLDECERPHWARGLCNMHYARHRKAGTLPPRVRFSGPCTAPGCELRAYALGRCRPHYDDARRTGELTAACLVPGCDLGGIVSAMCQPHGHRHRRYGLTPAALAAIDANPLCDVCGGPGQHVDHDHESGDMRGLLCRNCNTGLGLLNDDRALLATAILYLDRYEASRP